MRRCILGLVFVSAATIAPAMGASTDTDTVCATLYTYLADAARQNGMSASGFDASALKAQSSYLAQNPSEDSERYSIRVIDGAQTIRDGLASGALTSQSVMTTANTCNARYGVAAQN